jgi:subtilisin-like proprotein convertase family protein
LVSIDNDECVFPFNMYKASTYQTDTLGAMPVAIPDIGTVSVGPLVSYGIGTIRKVIVSIWLSHPRDSDLTVSLVGPDSTTVVLSDQNGDGADFGFRADYPTIFDDEASYSVTSNISPFFGSFAPLQPLAAFSGKSGGDANGEWTLQITDHAGGSEGQLLAWYLTIVE